MVGYELVRRAIEFKSPDRLPLRFWRLGCDDTANSGYRSLEKIGNIEARKKGMKEFTDEWGCVWILNPKGSNIDNLGYMKTHPLKNYALLKKCQFPDPDNPLRYENISSTLKESKGKYIISGWFTLFERAWQLRGMTNVFMDMYDNPEQFKELLDIISDFTIRAITNLSDFQGKIHGIEMGDDWGSQSGLFINFDQFRRFFKPCYKKIIDTAHRCGMHVWLHSDGKINDLIEEFIDIGLDVINLEQPLMVGIDEISHRYQGRIAFYPTIDIQKTLIKGSPEEIDAQAKALIDKWGTPQGGIIASDYWDYEALGIDQERARFALDAFKKYGEYYLGD